MAVVNSRAVVNAIEMYGVTAIRLASTFGTTLNQIIKSLFANNKQGFAYDPNDLSTMFQDAAGTTPVTGAGQSVGLILDKSGRGNHASQTVSASRPILQRNATTGAYYLAFDGADDFLQTNNINFTATDKVSLFAGVRKLSDASQGMIAELSSGNATGSFMLHCGGGSGSEAYTFGSRGSNTGYSYALLTKSVYPMLAAPKSSVITSEGVISTDLSKIKVDRTYSSSNPSIDQGTGNYGNYPLYIGRRAGTSLPFNGHLYSLIGIGRLTTDAETKALEKLIAKNTGVTLSV